MNDFDYLDDCVGRWEKLPVERLTRGQQTVLDVYGTITFIEGDGLLFVWSQFAHSMDRIMESFRLAGLGQFADLLLSARFCADIIARTSPSAEDWSCTDEEERAIRDVELSISDWAPHAREALLALLPKRKA